MTDSNGLYFGKVMHRRFKPVSHRLEYRVFSALIDLDCLSDLDVRLKLFSRGKFNLFSFQDRDYGEGGDDIAAHVRGLLREAGVAADGKILLLCYPRMLGYAFNPLAVYYCHDSDGRLAAALYEVRNTFGGKHSYLIPAEGDGGVIRQAADKVFHVSPFMEMETRYNFRLTKPDARIAVAIRQTDAEGPVLDAVFTGARKELTDRTLLAAFFAYPLMTFKVIVGIHWEALKLLLKGMKLRKGAPDPAHPVTVVNKTARLERAA